METTVRIVGFGDSVVSEVLDSADGGSIDRIEIPDLSDFSHGQIDWRGRLEGAHWLVLSTSTILAGDNAFRHFQRRRRRHVATKNTPVPID